MKRVRIARAGPLLLALAMVALGQGVKTYPGAKKYTPPESDEMKDLMKALPPGTQWSIYLTDDAYEKVAAFYKGVGKEYAMPGMPKGKKLPNGQELKQTYFIFDGAEDIASSKSWGEVQRPYVGSMEMKDGVPEYKDIRDVTSIQVVEKN